MKTTEEVIQAIDELIDGLTNEGLNSGDESCRQTSKAIRSQWEGIKMCWDDPDLRLLICVEYLRYQAEVRAGHIQ